MESIETLSAFFKLFELCGLQHFSLQNVIKKNQSRRSKIIHFVYFILLFAFNLFAVVIYVHGLVKLRERSISTRNMLTVLIKFTYNVGLVAAIIAGLVEGLVNMKQFKIIIALAIRLGKIFSSDFQFHSNYAKFKQVLTIRISGFFLVALTAIFILLSTSEHDVHIIFVIVIIVPELFVSMILVTFNFYVQLVNFQLECLVLVVIKSFRQAQFERSFAYKALSARRCYYLICKMNRLVNSVLRYSMLIVVTILVIGFISTTYDDFIKQILAHHTRKLLCKVLKWH